MSGGEKYDVLVLGSGTGGERIATTMAQEGMRTAVVERRYIGGAVLIVSQA
jgi:pyruvate/2-oxoglutarate dehydrogenase complex dihydrolipoamide dehydrogenase (E3) component